MDKWKEIWNKEERVNKIILESLIKADGFDSGAGSFSVDDWIVYTNELYKDLIIKQDDSIYDIGCGSGAFIYPLYLNNHKTGG
jgi:SAM-dependent methyltransferase